MNWILKRRTNARKTISTQFDVRRRPDYSVVGEFQGRVRFSC